MKGEKIYWRRHHPETDPKNNELILWDIFVDGEGNEYWYKVEWSVIDRHYVFRHFVQQGNMLSNLAKKANIDRDGNLRELIEEMNKALKNTIEEVNEIQDMRKENEELKEKCRKLDEHKNLIIDRCIDAIGKLREENKELKSEAQQWNRIKEMSLEKVAEIVEDLDPEKDIALQQEADCAKEHEIDSPT